MRLTYEAPFLRHFTAHLERTELAQQQRVERIFLPLIPGSHSRAGMS